MSILLRRQRGLPANIHNPFLGPLSFGGDQNSSFFGGNVTSAVNNGSVSETRVNDMIMRIMTPYFFLQQDEYPPIDGEEPALNSNFPPYDYQFTLGASNVDVRDDHNQLIRELGSAGTVLLKNVGITLPLKAPKTMGVFGNDAGDVVDGLYFSGAAFQNQYGYGEPFFHSSFFKTSFSSPSPSKTL